MPSVELHPSRCAICDTEGGGAELWAARLDLGAFGPAVFSARRLPDRVHYRLIRCKTCGLIRSDPVADPQVIAELYAQSAFEYGDQVADLISTYGGYLKSLSDKHGARKGALLEIGCGNGFLMEEALAQGYGTVRGVEPSAAAIERAGAHIRPQIVHGIIRAGLFEPEQFDVICMFQVFDHVPHPGPLLDECLRILKPGGLILCLNHNCRSLSARVLGERSPMVDVGHAYLYDPDTMRRLFEKHLFRVRHVGTAFNWCSLRYLTHLAPLPGLVKRPLLRFLKWCPIGRISLLLPLGNLYLVAEKPI